MLRKKKPVKHGVNPQKSGPANLSSSSPAIKSPDALHSSNTSEKRARMSIPIYPENSLADDAQFPLQDKFPDKTFLIRCEMCPPDVGTLFLGGFAELIDVRKVLVVNSSQMPEGSDSQSNHIRTRPKTIPVNEFGFVRILHRRICGSNRVPG